MDCLVFEKTSEFSLLLLREMEEKSKLRGSEFQREKDFFQSIQEKTLKLPRHRIHHKNQKNDFSS